MSLIHLEIKVNALYAIPMAKKLKRNAEQKLRCRLRELDHLMSQPGETDFLILQELAMKGPMPATQLADRVGLTSGSMTAALNRLEKAGSLTRKKTDLDRRRVMVTLNKDAYESLLEENRSQQKRLKKLFSSFSDREMALFSSLVKRASIALRK